MMAKINKTEISAEIPKRKKIPSFYYQNHTKTNQHMSSLSFKPNMKQIHGAVRAPGGDICFWRPSWIFLDKLNNAPKKFTRQIPQGQ